MITINSDDGSTRSWGNLSSGHAGAIQPMCPTHQKVDDHAEGHSASQTY